MQNETHKTWLMIALGCFCLLCTALDIYRGRVTISWRHRWGFLTYFDLHHDEAPILYWLHILIQSVLGTGLLGYSIQRLVEGP